jgi:hypothetical protein
MYWEEMFPAPVPPVRPKYPLWSTLLPIAVVYAVAWAFGIAMLLPNGFTLAWVGAANLRDAERRERYEGDVCDFNKRCAERERILGCLVVEHAALVRALVPSVAVKEA